MTAKDLAKALSGFQYRHNSEKELQAGIAQCLASLGVPFTPEYVLTPQDRVDFFIMADGIGIECKTNDSRGGAGLAAVVRQLWRYAKSDEIKAIILITTRSKHRDLPDEILGKPLYVVYLSFL